MPHITHSFEELKEMLEESVYSEQIGESLYRKHINVSNMQIFLASLLQRIEQVEDATIHRNR